MLGGTSPAASAMQPSDGACHDAAAGVGRRRLHSIAARIKQANSAVSQLTVSETVEVYVQELDDTFVFLLLARVPAGTLHGAISRR